MNPDFTYKREGGQLLLIRIPGSGNEGGAPFGAPSFTPRRSIRVREHGLTA